MVGEILPHFYFIFQGDDFMEDRVKKTIDSFTLKTAQRSNGLSSNNINKADYDKTLIGFVSEKIVPENPKDDNDYKWRIQTNGAAYDIKPSACNITSVGQRVRLYVPNHSLKDKYAEVIENSHPSKVVYDDNKDTITETWGLLEDETQDNSKTIRTYKLTIENKDSSNEEVTAITFPDGSVMKLEGFVIG